MKKILTIILDGFGMREDIYGNAIKNAGMNNFIDLWNNYPHCLLKSSEKAVGLPIGQCSNSELGHMIIGAGRPINNKLTYLNEIFKKDKLKTNEKFKEMVNYLNESKKSMHILFLLSDGGISSHIDHLRSFITNLKYNKVTNNIYLHLISDGKDSSRDSFNEYYSRIEDMLEENIHLGTICGRYYALDETKNYDRTKMYYDLLIDGKGVEAPNVPYMFSTCYSKRITDEYIPPLKSSSYVPFDINDVVFFLNFSKDNQRQILESLVKKDFNSFSRYNISLQVYSLFEIDKKINTNYFFENIEVEHTLGEYLSELGLNQARVCEEIKRKKVSYYFDGGKDVDIPNCDIYIAKSPKVNRFDEKPELNALTIAKTVIKCMDKDYDFIVANFANPDIVGHTGNYQATINSLQAIDVCLGKIIEVANDNFYKVIIVGSHSNADTIIDRQNNIMTKNTTSPVPFMILDSKIELENGSLVSVAPTILKYMDISLPQEMKETEILIKN